LYRHKKLVKRNEQCQKNKLPVSHLGGSIDRQNELNVNHGRRQLIWEQRIPPKDNYVSSRHRFKRPDIPHSRLIQVVTSGEEVRRHVEK